jgi:hypothetical protein
MSDPVTAAMVGAGISGGTSLLRGKSLGSSLQNAAIGGALGGAGSYLGGAMGGAGNVGGAAKGGINFSNIGSGLGGTTGLPVGGQGINVLGNVGTGITQTSNPLLYLDDAMNLTNPVTDSVFNKMGTSVIDSIKANPFPTLNLGLNAYDRMNQSQAPLQPSPMISAQQLIGQQGAVPIPQFNTLLQASRRPILIG